MASGVCDSRVFSSVGTMKYSVSETTLFSVGWEELESPLRVTFFFLQEASSPLRERVQFPTGSLQSHELSNFLFSIHHVRFSSVSPHRWAPKAFVPSLQFPPGSAFTAVLAQL